MPSGPTAGRRGLQPGPSVRRLGGHARRGRRGHAPPGRAAPGPGHGRHRVRRAARRAGGHPGHPGPSAGGGRGGRPVRARQHEAEPGGRSPARLPPRRPRRDPPGRALRRRPRGAAPEARCTRGRPARRGARRPPPARTDRPPRPGSGSLRTLALGLSMAEKGDAKAISFVEDTAVAPEHLRDYIAEFLRIIARHGTRAGRVRPRLGRLPARPPGDRPEDRGGRPPRSRRSPTRSPSWCSRYGGALSGEHGDGLVRSPFQEKMFGPVLYRAFRELKRALRPAGPASTPGKIVDAPPLATNLRYGAGYVTPEVPTLFDFSADGGLGRAAELCSGVGECRKTRGGTMCPSYQATRDERDSTRGRANALRLAITGQADLDGLTDPAVRRGARPVPGVQGVQGRVPDQRGHGPAQGGGPAPLPSRARTALAEPGVRPRRRPGPLGLPPGARLGLGRCGAALARGWARPSWGSTAAACPPPSRGGRSPAAWLPSWRRRCPTPPRRASCCSPTPSRTTTSRTSARRPSRSSGGRAAGSRSAPAACAAAAAP